MSQRDHAAGLRMAIENKARETKAQLEAARRSVKIVESGLKTGKRSEIKKSKIF